MDTDVIFFDSESLPIEEVPSPFYYELFSLFMAAEEFVTRPSVMAIMERDSFYLDEDVLHDIIDFLGQNYHIDAVLQEQGKVPVALDLNLHGDWYRVLLQEMD